MANDYRRVADQTASCVPGHQPCWVSALGGWPGGLAGMLPFHHKTAKTSFKLKFAAAFLVWAGLSYARFAWG